MEGMVLLWSHEAFQVFLRTRSIKKTYLYNFDPLKPHFYIVKLGFTGVYIIFLFLPKNIDSGYSLEAVLTSTHNLCFEQVYEKISEILIWKLSFFGCKFSIYLK